jgi:hypothetical protein
VQRFAFANEAAAAGVTVDREPENDLAGDILGAPV